MLENGRFLTGVNCMPLLTDVSYGMLVPSDSLEQKMPSIMQRTLTVTTGKRASIKLDSPTWRAVEFLAGERGLTWQQWCAQVLVNVDGAENMTASVREAAMAGLLTATIYPNFEDRAEQLALQDANALMRNSGTMDDKLLNAILKRAKVQGGSDFGGFEVLFGFDEHGQDCVWIKNKIVGGLHFVLQAA
jgi:predicted DNA-binding ribbon-helix-helix protein